MPESIENLDDNNPEKPEKPKHKHSAPANNNEKNIPALQVDIDEATAQGCYANLVMTNFNSEEFILDFIFLQPQMPKGKIRSRVILSPKNVKRLAKMLKANVHEYEKKFGPLSEHPEEPGVKLSFN